jgi:outer membrane protein assembly factor BamD (BamD/ComL family)
MSKNLLAALVLSFAFAISVPAVWAQGTVRSGPDPSTMRDPELEKDSQHNLEVARNYFKLKKAYVATLKRCEEIIAGNPNFARIDEVLLMAGQSSLWLSQNKGKQRPEQYVSFDGGEKRTLTPQQFREMGVDYLKMLIKGYPESPFAKQAQAELGMVGEAKKQ